MPLSLQKEEAPWSDWQVDLSIMHTSFPELLREIQNKDHPLIGIDGFGAAGKSTLAEKIKSRITSAQIIHIDDFYKPSQVRSGKKSHSILNEDFDWDRLEEEVFNKIINNKSAFRYQRYDWVSDTLAEFIQVDARLPIIVEGVFSLQRRFFNLYDVTIWIDVSEDAIIKRAIERDGIAVMDKWINEWQPIERNYFQSERPDTKAQFVVLGE